MEQQLPEATRWLLEQQTLVRAPKREPLPTPITGGGSAPTVVVAASDSTQYSKDRADFVCTGVNDEMIIQRAINICSSSGGLVWLCEGGYQVEVPTTGPAITLESSVKLLGVGPGYDSAGAALVMSNVSDPGRFPVLLMEHHTAVQNLTIYTFDSALPIQLAWGAGVIQITDCWLEPRDAPAIEGENNSFVWIERNILAGSGSFATEDDSLIHLYAGAGDETINISITRNVIESGWHGVFIDGVQGRNVIHDNHFLGQWFSNIRLKSDDLPIFATSIMGNLLQAPGTGSDGSTGEACAYISGDPTDIDPLTSQSNGVVIVGNRFEVAAVCYAVRLSGVALAMVHSNYIEQPGLHGIFLEDANGCQIFDNIIQEPDGFPTTTFDGIHLVTSDGNYILANTVIEHGGGSPNFWRYAINISDAASADNIVIANDLRLAGSGTGFINNAGTGTRLAWPAGGAGIGDNWV